MKTIVINGVEVTAPTDNRLVVRVQNSFAIPLRYFTEGVELLTGGWVEIGCAT